VRKFRQTDSFAYTKNLNLQTDALWLQLHSPSFAPNLDTMIRSTDLTNELPTGGGYTVGGLQLAGTAVAYTAAASWGYPWVASAAHQVEDVVRPPTANGYLYRCAVAGTSGAAQPTWPLGVGQTVTDGSVTWECCGSGLTALTASNVTWPAPFTAGPIRYAVLIDKTPASPILVALADFGTPLSGQAGSFSEQFTTSGIFYLFES